MIDPTHGHDPVLLRQVLQFLNPQPGEIFADCTTGRGGHALALAKHLLPTGALLALDVDPDNLTYAKKRINQELHPSSQLEQPNQPPPPANIRYFQANFAELEDVLDQAGIDQLDGLLADLGVSTNQLTESSHGLSFSADAPLDMRLDPRIKLSAADLLATLDEKQIADLLYHNAQERFAYKIARKIISSRVTQPIRTTSQLARLVRSVVPGKPGQIDPATRTFQALRMAVNEELESLEALLDAIPDLMKPGGRVAIISFHSGEDRLVKQATREWAKEGWCELLTRKPIEPDEEETYKNPRSRSAKLRAVRFLNEGESKNQTETQSHEDTKDHEDQNEE